MIKQQLWSNKSGSTEYFLEMYRNDINQTRSNFLNMYTSIGLEISRSIYNIGEGDFHHLDHMEVQ